MNASNWFYDHLKRRGKPVVKSIHHRVFLPIMVLLVLSAGCQRSQSPVNLDITKTPARPASSATFLPSPSESPPPTKTLTVSPTAPAAVCSPLQGIALDELAAITSFTFNYPSAFSDDFHPAVDLAFFSYKDFKTIHGLPVQSIFPGKVVQVIDNLFPYGNMILIETPLSVLQAEQLDNISIPTPIPDKNIALFSTCSRDIPPITWSNDSRSVYTLYAHLDTKPDFKIGESVSCGQQIGAVGLSGNTVAEHLHLEVRIGPSNAQFGTLSMYTPSATPEERYNYCIWSISGHFQAIDPAAIWVQKP